MHDYLLVMRGAERTFAAIADCWPDAPVYTLLHDRKAVNGPFENRPVHTSFLQSLHAHQAGFRRLLPLFPLAAERLRLDHDLVISSTSAFAHGVSTREDATHVAYCYTPFRYAWHERDRAVAEAPAPLRPVVRRVLGRIRKWDRKAADRVTHYIAISELSRARIQDFYGRDAPVVHPPVNVYRSFRRREPEEYFLVVTEVVPHKRVRNALEAARRAGRAIKVVGGGPELDDLRREYASSATFLGRVSDEELDELYSRARALVVPNIEEFGIAAVEAQAAGRPVLAADAGGARETVRDGETGVLVPPENVDALAESMVETDWDAFDAERIREHALGFSESAFQRRFLEEIHRLTGHPLSWRKPEVMTRTPTLG